MSPTCSSMSAQGLPRSASSLGAVRTVKSAGLTSSSSSQDSGNETGAPGSGRGLSAAAIVRSRLAWLKSTKTRSPRSSFHQLLVTRSGIRRSSSRAMPMTPWRTSWNSWVGAIRA
ncbi:Uncharacterised protein [Mycobacteroides abscessus subsp. abscessus]|nr:Uncharacterised protein [Mycobacteroides abscessus subsp. abscessus]